MNIKPLGNTPPVAVNTGGRSEYAAKAVAALEASMTQNVQPTPQTPPIPVNANNVSPEEYRAVQPPTEQRQTDNHVDQSEVTETTQETPKEDPALSRQFAQLARQEKAMRMKAMQQDQALKAREAAIAAREAELNGRKAPEVDMNQYISKSRFKEDPLAALQDAGATYEELTERMINSQPTDPYVKLTISRLEAKIQQMEEQQAESRRAQENQQSEAYQAAVKQIEAEAKKLVYTDPNFEMTKATNSTKDIVDLIERTFKEDGVLMTVQEAAEQVEAYIEENITKLTNLDKIKRKMQTVAPKASSTTTQPPVETSKQPQPMKTLTNKTSSVRQLSARERAISAFRGEKA